MIISLLHFLHKYGFLQNLTDESIEISFLNDNMMNLLNLFQFLDWSAQTLLAVGTSERDRVGALLSVAAIYKHGARADLLPHAQTMLEVVTRYYET